MAGGGMTEPALDLPPEAVTELSAHDPQGPSTAEPADAHGRTSAGSGPGTDLARRERRSEVIRPLNADELVDSFHAYQELLPKLLNESDYQAAEAGKKFVKKSGWRKIATAFDLDVQIVHEEVERDTDGRVLRAKTTVRATAPSGRVMDGDGYCTVDEFTGRRARNPKLENDLRGTAATRAKNRAISDLVGMGEVSAEEVHVDHHAAPAPPEWAQPASAQLIGTLRRALGYLLDPEGDATSDNVGRVIVEIEKATGETGLIPRIVAQSIVHVAATHKAALEGSGATDA